MDNEIPISKEKNLHIKPPIANAKPPSTHLKAAEILITRKILSQAAMNA